MLSKCMNPLCAARFRYLHEGRIFNIERVVSSSDAQFPPNYRVEHYWLCARCAQTLKVVLDRGMVTTRPLHPALPPASSASAA